MPTRTNRTMDLVEVLRTIPRSTLPIGVAWNKCKEAADEIERLRQERDKATIYAESLAVALSHHFPHVPQWKPLTGDLIGLLTQIDNMTTGLLPADEIERLRAENERLREALDILQAAMVGKKPIPMAFKVAINNARAALEQKF